MVMSPVAGFIYNSLAVNKIPFVGYSIVFEIAYVITPHKGEPSAA